MELEYHGLFPFWLKLTPEQQDLLIGSAQVCRFAKGSIVHNGAADCVGLFFVLEGQLRLFTSSEEGKELTLSRLVERDICLLSASCMMNSLQFDVVVSAEEDTVALQIPPEVYKQLMEQSAAVANYTSELMATTLTDVMWLMDQIQHKKLDGRVAALLLEEATLRDDKVLSLTHEHIANHLGSAREVVTRMLKYFQNEGLVRLGRGSIELLDEARLEQLAEGSRR